MKNKINKAMKVLKVVLNIFMWACGMVFILFLFYDNDSEETAMLIHSTFGYFITFLILYVLYRMVIKIIFRIDNTDFNKDA
jgi:predicted membrane protein